MTAKDWMTSAMCQSWKRWKVVSRIGLDAEQRVKSGRGEMVLTRMGLDDQSNVSGLEDDKTRRVQWDRITGAGAQYSDQLFYFPSQVVPVVV